jgi:hypothetical protein
VGFDRAGRVVAKQAADLAAELPRLLTVLSVRLGRIERVSSTGRLEAEAAQRRWELHGGRVAPSATAGRRRPQTRYSVELFSNVPWSR